MPGQTTFVALGVLTIVVGYPLLRRWVPRNRWYGLRVAATFADPFVWYEANAAVGRDFVLLGAALLAVALLLPRVVALPVAWYTGVCVTLCVAGSLLSLTRASRVATKLLSDRRN
ncbi:MAG TPA: SdpI family protein [Gemmatimonadales bacterium]|nr:SdpI family protein [Gemmatimonadales bacterium]